MPRRSTSISIGFTYHIYNRSVAGNSLFLDHENYRFFLSKMEKYIQPIGEILAFCLMPNHYHILLRLEQPTLAEAMQRMALSYTVPFNAHNKRAGHLFQGRYQLKHVNDLQYLVHLSRYIHLNPQAAGLVENAEHWVYSSLRDYYGLRRKSLANPSILLDIIADDSRLEIEEKRRIYREFIDEWNPDYMDFKLK